MDQSIKVSLFASAVRPALWEKCLESLNAISHEVIFAGFCKKEIFAPFVNKHPFFRYIHTENIKPAQAYEIARRECKGEVVVWIADDAEFVGDIIGRAYEYWKSKNDRKLILSLQSKETGYNVPDGILQDMKQHSFFGMCPNTPLMAPWGMMSREFLDELGGIDRRYVCGQYENSVVMRARQHGASVEVFGDDESYIWCDHLGKSLAIGESQIAEDFINRPFARGYAQDRQVLESSWCRVNVAKLTALSGGRGHMEVKMGDIYDISPVQLDAFEPYPKDISLIKSEEPRGIWE